jgi:hypothetical protein
VISHFCLKKFKFVTFVAANQPAGTYDISLRSPLGKVHNEGSVTLTLPEARASQM